MRLQEDKWCWQGEVCRREGCWMSPGEVAGGGGVTSEAAGQPLFGLTRRTGYLYYY